MAGHAGRGIKALIEARNGSPTEEKAVGTIAMFAVIPATMVGLLVATFHWWDKPGSDLNGTVVGGRFS